MRFEQTLFLVPNNNAEHNQAFIEELLPTIQETFPISYIATGGGRIRRIEWLPDLSYTGVKYRPESFMQQLGGDNYLDLRSLIRKLMSEDVPYKHCRVSHLNNLIIISDCDSLLNLDSDTQSWLVERNVLFVTQERANAEELLAPVSFPFLTNEEATKLRQIKIMDWSMFLLFMQMAQVELGDNEYSHVLKAQA